jgi:hypothetical protein
MKLAGASVSSNAVKAAKQKRMDLLKSKLKMKGKMIATFSKMISSFPCQSHTMLFRTSAPLVNLINKKLPGCPQWKLGKIKHYYTTTGYVLIECVSEAGRGPTTEEVARVFILDHGGEGATVPPMTATNQMDAAKPLHIDQRVVYLSQVSLMEHCHGERSLSADTDTSAHAFKVWHDAHHAWLHGQHLHQWSELDFDEADLDWLLMDPLALVHHQRFPGDPATGSGLRVLLSKLEQLRRRVQRRRSGFEVDKHALVTQKASTRGGNSGGDDEWPMVSESRAEYGDDGGGDEGMGEPELDRQVHYQYPLAHPVRPGGRKRGKGGATPSLLSAEYCSKLYAEAKSVLPTLSDVCATAASHGHGIRSRGGKLIGPYHACQAAWNTYGHTFTGGGGKPGAMAPTSMRAGGFSRVMELLKCRIECDDETDLEEALLQLRVQHEDDGSPLRLWHTKRLASELTAYPLTYHLTAEVHITVERGGVRTVHRSLCTIEVVALSVTKPAEEPEEEKEQQWVGDVSTVLQKKKQAKAAIVTRDAQAARDAQVPHSNDENDQRRRLNNRTQWLNWYASTLAMSAGAVRRSRGHAEDEKEDEKEDVGHYQSPFSSGIYFGQTQLRQREKSTEKIEAEEDAEDEDQPHGYGTLLEESGARYEGMWRHGKRHGFGERVEENGEHFRGHYADGRRHGVGMWSESGGSLHRHVYHGTFFRGELDHELAHVIYSPDAPPIYFNPARFKTAAAAAARAAISAAAEASSMVAVAFAAEHAANEKLKQAVTGKMHDIDDSEHAAHLSAYDKEKAAAQLIRVRNTLRHAAAVAATAANAAVAAWIRANDPHAKALAAVRARGKRGTLPAITLQPGAFVRSRADSMVHGSLRKAKQIEVIDVLPTAPPGLKAKQGTDPAAITFTAPPGCEEGEAGAGLTITWERTAEDRGDAMIKTGRHKKDMHKTKTMVRRYEVEWVLGKCGRTVEKDLDDVVDEADGPFSRNNRQKNSLLSQLKGGGAKQTCSLGLHWLKPCTVYTLRVRGWSQEHGWGHWTTGISMRTAMAVPDQVDFVCLDDSTSTMCEISWDAVMNSSSQSGAHVNQYEVMWREVHQADSGPELHMGSLIQEVTERPRSGTRGNGASRRGSFIGMTECNATVVGLHPGRYYEVGVICCVVYLWIGRAINRRHVHRMHQHNMYSSLQPLFSRIAHHAHLCCLSTCASLLVSFLCMQLRVRAHNDLGWGEWSDILLAHTDNNDD